MAVLAADLAGTGGHGERAGAGWVTDTPLVGDAGDRAKMLRPEIMVPPLLWLVSGRGGRRSAGGDSLRPIGRRCCRPGRRPRRPAPLSPGSASRGCRSSPASGTRVVRSPRTSKVYAPGRAPQIRTRI